MITIGVFDSGIGGRAIADYLKTEFASAKIIYVNDREHMPYGTKTAEQIIALTDQAIQPLLSANCDVIVIACNTATAAAIETLRQRYKTQFFVGLEPMVKTAASLTKTGKVAICATNFTLSSDRYQNLKQRFAAKIEVIEPDCSRWAYMIEHSDNFDHELSQTIEQLCDQGADVIVLACTHYHWIRQKIESVAKSRALVIDPSRAIAKRIRSRLNISEK